MTNVKTVVASKADKAAYNKAKAAEASGYGAFVLAIQTIAPHCAEALEKEKLSVAEFAAYVGDDLSVGKDVAEADKAERNRIRARIRYALNEAEMLEEKARSPKQGKKGKASKGQAADKAEAAADAADKAKSAANDTERFQLVCDMLDSMSRDTLQRVANAVATRLAAATEAKTEAPAKPSRKRKAATK